MRSYDENGRGEPAAVAAQRGGPVAPSLAGIRSRARRSFRAAVALAVAAVSLSGTPSALAATQPGLIVMPHVASRPGLSYFKLAAPPGSARSAGTIELRNPTAYPLRIALSPVDGETLSTLGSSYAPAGSRPHGSTLWLHLGRRAVTLAPGAAVAVPVAIAVPPGVPAGDYLSGVSIEALDQRATAVGRRGVSIASTSRYAIGAEISLPGPRHKLIQLTGARIEREPSGLTFALDARNSGNAILQGVYGHLTVTRGGHIIASQAIQAGTFLAHTSIAYPVNAFRQTPPQGTHYRVSAVLHYDGGVARLHTTVTFGHRAAVTQQQYGGPAATSPGTAWWKLAGLIVAILYGLTTTTLLLLRRMRSPGHARTANEL